jgi:hypothetical protein
MPDLRCPKLDLLGRALIEAYRRREESLAYSVNPEQTAIAEDTIARLHELIAGHRTDCFLCQKKVPRPVLATEGKILPVRNVA